MDTMNMMSLKLIYLTACPHVVQFAFLELERELVEAEALRFFLQNTVLSLAWTPLLALLSSNQHAKT